jgi:uncharacterized Rossmann fold enzyme
MRLNQFLIDDEEEELFSVIKGRSVAVVGAGPSLELVREIKEEVIIAADGASRFLEELFRPPDVIVTDLDGIEKTNGTSIYVVHAHGDNVARLEKVLEFRRVIGTCQVANTGRAKLYGGFTDGDRATLLALVAGATKVKLYAMDLDSDLIGRYSKPYLSEHIAMSRRKKVKLSIAKEVISTLGDKVTF